MSMLNKWWRKMTSDKPKEQKQIIEPADVWLLGSNRMNLELVHEEIQKGLRCGQVVLWKQLDVFQNIHLQKDGQKVLLVTSSNQLDDIFGAIDKQKRSFYDSLLDEKAIVIIIVIFPVGSKAWEDDHIYEEFVLGQAHLGGFQKMWQEENSNIYRASYSGSSLKIMSKQLQEIDEWIRRPVTTVSQETKRLKTDPGDTLAATSLASTVASVTNDVGIISLSQEYLNALGDSLREVIGDEKITFQEKWITSHKCTDDLKEFITNCHKVMLVAVRDERLVIISDREDSQLGYVYDFAKEHGKVPFLILVGHGASESLDGESLFHDSVKREIRNQPEIDTLLQKRRFISMGRICNQKLPLNDGQIAAIIEWIDSEP